MNEFDMARKRYVFPTNKSVRYRFPTHINDLVMDRADAETSEAFIVIINPGEASPLHVHHDTEQIYYVLKGSGMLQIDEENSQRFRIRPGDLIRIPAHVVHNVCCEGENPLEYLAVDCFLGGRPDAEPTWDSHAKAVADGFGWDFAEVRQDR